MSIKFTSMHDEFYMNTLREKVNSAIRTTTFVMKEVEKWADKDADGVPMCVTYDAGGYALAVLRDLDKALESYGKGEYEEAE